LKGTESYVKTAKGKTATKTEKAFKAKKSDECLRAVMYHRLLIERENYAIFKERLKGEI